MNCTCEVCNGRGVVTCDDCGGRGNYDHSIETFTVEATHPQAAELFALQEDAKRCRKSAEELIRLNPLRVASYQDQMRATLEKIEQQANKVLAKK